MQLGTSAELAIFSQNQKPLYRSSVNIHLETHLSLNKHSYLILEFKQAILILTCSLPQHQMLHLVKSLRGITLETFAGNFIFGFKHTLHLADDD